jgi:hypothetical protein
MERNVERGPVKISMEQDNSGRVLLERRYEEMKRFYDNKVKDMDRELLEYKEMVKHMQ